MLNLCAKTCVKSQRRYRSLLRQVISTLATVHLLWSLNLESWLSLAAQCSPEARAKLTWDIWLNLTAVSCLTEKIFSGCLLTLKLLLFAEILGESYKATMVAVAPTAYRITHCHIGIPKYLYHIARLRAKPCFRVWPYSTATIIAQFF